MGHTFPIVYESLSDMLLMLLGFFLSSVAVGNLLLNFRFELPILSFIFHSLSVF